MYLSLFEAAEIAPGAIAERGILLSLGAIECLRETAPPFSILLVPVGSIPFELQQFVVPYNIAQYILNQEYERCRFIYN